MIEVKIFDQPEWSLYGHIYTLQQFKPTEIVVMEHEIWAYWVNKFFYQIKDLQPKLERYGYKLDWYEEDGFYQGMIYLQL